MNDPRLNSIHLNAARRDDFRRARQGLLHARGPETLASEAASAPSPFGTDTSLAEPAADHPRRLVLVEDDQVHQLKVGMNTLGRLPDNDVVVTNPHVSRRHCAILVHADAACELHDVASKNGTYLNGRRITAPTRLQAGDIIRVSDCCLVVQREDGDSSTSHFNAV